MEAISIKENTVKQRGSLGRLSTIRSKKEVKKQMEAISTNGQAEVASAKARLHRKEVLVLLARYGVIISLAVMSLGFSVFLPPFRTQTNLMNLMGAVSILSILAAGMTCCLKVGDFDLSIGGIAALSSLVVAWLMSNGHGIPISIFAALGTGIFLGLMNGLLVAYVGLSPFVCTLATLSVILGFGLWFTKGISIWTGIPPAFEVIGRGNVGGIPVRFIIMIVLLAAIWFFHNYMERGRHMEAIGGNPVAARLSGINVERNRMLAFVFSGFCSAVAGVVLTSALMSANSTQGTHYLLEAFAACFIGAVTIKIGQFHILGTFIGVLLTVVAVNGLMILGVSGYLTDLIKGGILLLAILLSGTLSKFLRA